MRLFLDGAYFTPALAAQRDSAIAFARYCLPQVFFYGMFVLVGQVLNARGRFGPMMWAPIANNVISVAVLVRLPVISARCRTLRRRRRRAADRRRRHPGQELLLGLGSTAGIVGPAADPAAVPARGPGSGSSPGSTSAAPASATRCGWASGR